ncbi:hypothetical protein KR018_009518 [Drosophila ironensis]|nr:hypothetical protein KR018_009518 [Drosophila ironensis]
MFGGQQAAASAAAAAAAAAATTAQVTPTGAAIKMHFACNNSNISSMSNINNIVYSGLKTAENKRNNNGTESSVLESLRADIGPAPVLGSLATKLPLMGVPPGHTLLGVVRSVSGLTSMGPAGAKGGAITGLRWLPMPKPIAVGGPGGSVGAGAGSGGVGGAAKSALVITTTAANQQMQMQMQMPIAQRTEDQENAFRRIEDVHNYAKLQDYSSDDEDDEEEEEEEDGDEDEEDVAELPLPPAQPEVTRIQREDTEDHVDVVTIPQPEHECNPVQPRKPQQRAQQPEPEPEQEQRPEHHARRPMNAFLIFCKRHRAIVKERYKTLENRAITKILGDWWAALDENEKHCFTDLAQQNKDAFFNANPNFKWYKLPAPPLRTLATRPSNATAAVPGGAAGEEQQMQKLSLDLLRRDYFKLADETQMGELSSLLQVQVQAQAQEQEQQKDFALQQALSETSQFLSAHMPGATGKERPVTGANKRTFDSNSSNSSEEEAVGGATPNKKAKSSRSCKGKIYQELVNSGQLAAINKKAKGSHRSTIVGGNFADIPLDAAPNTPPTSPPERQPSSPVGGHQRSVSESSSSGFFDLEEKIKELPALSLDAYLQRKRSTKKKKKFSGTKKRFSSFNSMTPSEAAAAASNDLAEIKQQLQDQQQQQQQVQMQQQQKQKEMQQRQQAGAVGSQRRKARKESITRRDVSAIEQEVASILPLTINGCYYYDESPGAKVAATASTSSSPPLSSNSSNSSSSLDVTSSTSDLLILAEVAANRTELAKSN